MSIGMCLLSTVAGWALCWLSGLALGQDGVGCEGRVVEWEVGALGVCEAFCLCLRLQPDAWRQSFGFSKQLGSVNRAIASFFVL